MLTFAEKERECERIFEKSGPFWHLYTDGRVMEDFLCTEEDFKIAMTALAVAAVLFKKVRIITFELMSNHIHMILNGEAEDCLELFERFKARLRRILKTNGRIINWDAFKADILPIETLNALRNEIIYANRNAFVANPQFTPFNYPWGGGCAFFQPYFNRLPARSLRELGFNKARELTHFREIRLIEDLKFFGDIVFIPSFCRTDIGESMFRDARSYFNSLTRNAEAFSQIAQRLKDSVFLTDEEMYAAATMYAENTYGNRQLSLLNPEQKIQLSKELHFKYNASNQQIRRLLKLDIGILNELFPQQSS
ncbi:MAG: hypothetical protein IJB05_03505 [Bacteroidales bacterium]|nr:hypothetical protein [Bacteroidales bacterium]